MKFNVTILLFATTLIFGCVSKSKFILVESEITRLKSDSALLEKRIAQLSNENAGLQTLSATIEQALNVRLQEKEDSLNYKEKLLKEREFSLKDMKARKEEEQEAFYSLTRKVFAEFADYDASTLTTKTNCTQAVIAVNDKKLFTGNTAKTEYLATEINNKAGNLLSKHPDLMLTVVCYVDSNMQISAKEDCWNIALLRANALSKMLITTHKNLSYKVKSTTGLPTNTHINKNATYFIEYQFTSNLTPCIPIK
jgi:chemotaxis protein MotB